MHSVSKLLALFIFVISLAAYATAIEGYFIGKDKLTGIPVAYSGYQNYSIYEEECNTNCSESATCEAYAVSYYNNVTCILYDQAVGYEMPEDNSYNFYTLVKSKEDGYFMIGQKYIQPHFYLKSRDAAMEICKEQSGSLVNDDSDEVHKFLINVMAHRLIYRTWIGISDEYEEGVWKDSHGSDRADHPYWIHLGKWISYRKNCAILVYGEEYGWKHEYCGAVHTFFCEIPLFL